MTGVSPAARLNNVSWLAGNCLTINYLPEILGANGAEDYSYFADNQPLIDQ